jgi:hypothetical protein
MRKPLTFLAVLSLFQVNAQINRTNFDFNQSSGIISANGIFFKDAANGLAAYAPNKFLGITAIYQSSFSASGTDVNGQNKMSVATYDETDFSCGPIANNYSDPNYVAKFGNSLWEVYQTTIDLHIQNWNTSGYQMHPSIASWPGNGDVSNGMAAQLAPYADINGNGIYDPENGDYPEILGDAAVYLIVNDQNNTQIPGTMPLNMELHYMFYQFAAADPLNNTTFVNIKAYNRGTVTCTDFKFNALNDFDLGNYTDDFGGVDVSRNLVYVYNGDGNDEAIAGRPGYTTNPPAIGFLSLNHPLNAAIFPDSIPDPNSEFLNVIDGKQVDGTAITNNGTPTLFHYSDTLSNGYNEVALNHVPGDKRSFSTIYLGTFAPNSVKCLDFAWIYARPANGSSLFNSVDSLMKVADFVQNLYDNTNHCMDGTLQVESLKSEQFGIYPNPSNGEITCASDQNLELIEVWNMDGKLIRTVPANGKETKLDLSQLNAGVYLIKLSTAGETKTMPFYKQ